MRRGLLLTVLLAASVTSPGAHARAMPDPSQTPAPGNEVPQIPLSRAGYSPAVNYQLQCAGCHLPQGQGAPRNDVPRMTGFVGNFLRVDGGREFLVRVPGVAQSALDDGQLAELLNWILARDGMAGASTPEDAAPYTRAEVERIRATRLSNLPDTRARLIQSMRDRGIAIDDGMPHDDNHNDNGDSR